MFDRTIAAFTECPPNGHPPNEFVQYVNISANDGGEVRITVRNRDGSSAAMDLKRGDWFRFKSEIVERDGPPGHTHFELRWGSERDEEQRRYFPAHQQCDAAVRLSERIVALDGDASIRAAFASLVELPTGRTLVSWTKCSDERPTSEGDLDPPTDPQP